MIEPKDITAIGKFQKTHALKGELNAILDIAPEFVEEKNAIVVDIDGIFVPFYAESIRTKGSTSFLIKIEGVDSESEARGFVNKTIYAEKSQLAPFLEMEESEIFDEDDLEGYKIIDAATRREVGEVVRMDTQTANVLFIVATSDGSEVFIPAVEEFIEEVDDQNRIIYMSLPEGLVDLN